MQHISYFILDNSTPSVIYNQPSKLPYVVITIKENETTLKIESDNSNPKATFDMIEAFSKNAPVNSNTQNTSSIEDKIKLKTETEGKLEKQEKNLIQKIFSSEEKEVSLEVLLQNHKQFFKELIDNKIQKISKELSEFEKQIIEEGEKLHKYQNEEKELQAKNAKLEKKEGCTLDEKMKQLVKEIEQKEQTLKKLNDKNLTKASQLNLQLEIESLGKKVEALHNNSQDIKQPQDQIKNLEKEIQEKQKELISFNKLLSNTVDAEELEKVLGQEIEKINSQIDEITKEQNAGMLSNLFNGKKYPNPEIAIKNLQEILNKKIIFHSVIETNNQMQAIAENIDKLTERIDEYSELLKNIKDKNLQIESLNSGISIMKEQLKAATNVLINISEISKGFEEKYKAVSNDSAKAMITEMDKIITEDDSNLAINGMIKFDVTEELSSKHNELLTKIEENKKHIEQAFIKIEVEGLNKEIYELGLNRISKEECAKQLSINVMNLFLTEIRKNTGNGILFDRQESPWAEFLRKQFGDEALLVSDAISAIKKVGDKNHDANYYLQKKEMNPIKKLSLKLYDICLAWIPFVSKSRSLQREKISKFMKYAERNMNQSSTIVQL